MLGEHTTGATCGLEAHGIRNTGTVYWNLPTAALVEKAIQRREGWLAHRGPFVAHTGDHTGRSPNDRFIVEDETSRESVDWGGVNKPFSADGYARLKAKMMAHLQNRDLFVEDCHAGADPAHRLDVRVIAENAWHALFARNMFRTPEPEDLVDFRPGFTVIQVPSFHANADKDGTNGPVFILVNLTEREVLIGGTSYAGEAKKSIFSVMNHYLPDKGVLPMHCSVNAREDGSNGAIFFGLSGTGKTTLSATTERMLIGDDEHGWSDDGVFNFEGGCYAKVIRLDRDAEPVIWAMTRRFETVLENVVMDMDSRRLDLDDASLTENTRASYPIDAVPHASPTGRIGQPEHVFMLTADAFGVLPPIARLSPEQASYHFLSGYTARVAGTEKGVKEPQATFSACFGAPFMPRHPSVYGRLLAERVNKHGTTCWLVNTGWTGGPYGTGRRMPIQHTRATIDAALSGALDGVDFRVDPVFGLSVPTSCPGVPDDELNPRATWASGEAYDAQAHKLARMFADNFAKYDAHVDDAVRAVAVGR